MQATLRELWKDPVWSKVIATLIVAVLAFLLRALFNWEAAATSLIDYEVKIKAWIFAAIIFGTAIVCWLRMRNGRSGESRITSAQWFEEIEKQIKDCNCARIYLREFAHPDNFRPEHRESLLSFMKSLVNRLKAGTDIKIIAYHENSSEKSGLDWLKAEIQESATLLGRIKLIKVQPTSNSTSMYLFDNGTLIYNRRSQSNYSYHIENQSGSIVHLLIKSGFSEIDRESS